MAAQKTDIGALCRALKEDIRAGKFAPVYLLMGDEPFYPDMICSEIVENCIDPSEKDFNEVICYGPDVNAEQVISAARQFPMMGERLLVVLKEAQLMKSLEELAVYVEAPQESTVLVILMHGASADKRKALYKSAQKNGVVVDSPVLREWELVPWIGAYYKSRGLDIEPKASALLAESVGADLAKIAVETDKLMKSLPVGTVQVRVEDIERNVGISRQYNVFELGKAIVLRQNGRALKIAAHIGNGARFFLPMAVSAIYGEFSKILKYAACGDADRARIVPYFRRDYDAAVRNYPLPKAMAAVSILREYDFLGKGGDGGRVDAGDLLVEMTAKILSL